MGGNGFKTISSIFDPLKQNPKCEVCAVSPGFYDFLRSFFIATGKKRRVSFYAGQRWKHPWKSISRTLSKTLKPLYLLEKSHLTGHWKQCYNGVVPLAAPATWLVPLSSLLQRGNPTPNGYLRVERRGWLMSDYEILSLVLQILLIIVTGLTVFINAKK